MHLGFILSAISLAPAEDVQRACTPGAAAGGRVRCGWRSCAKHHQSWGGSAQRSEAHESLPEVCCFELWRKAISNLMPLLQRRALGDPPLRAQVWCPHAAGSGSPVTCSDSQAAGSAACACRIECGAGWPSQFSGQRFKVKGWRDTLEKGAARNVVQRRLLRKEHKYHKTLKCRPG